MKETELKKVQIMRLLIEKSLFTNKQYDIICNIAKNKHSYEEISSGAYFRQVKQCKKKIIEVFYCLLLLRITGIFDSNIISLTEKLSEHLNVIFSSSESDIFDISKLITVIKSLDDLLVISLNKKRYE